MSTVIVAEKPSVARDIARLLGADAKRDGYLETRDGERVVTWALGHLVRYAEPDDYGTAWSGKWGFGATPDDTADVASQRAEGTGKQFDTVRRLINGAERVICATDAGREGEHIFRLIYARGGLHGAGPALWVSSLTPAALKAGFQNLLPGRTFDALAESARARAQADWLVGMNLTRAYTRSTAPCAASAGCRRLPCALCGGARPADRGIQSQDLLRGDGARGAGFRCPVRPRRRAGRHGQGTVEPAPRQTGRGGRRRQGRLEAGRRRGRGRGPQGAAPGAGAVRPDGPAARG